MKRIIIYLAIACLTIGCSVDEPNGLILEEGPYSIDKPYVYEAFESKEVWKTLTSFDEKLNACQVPSSIARELTTEALIQTCLDHPLVGLYLAYDDEFEIVKILSEQNNAFIELLNRKDSPGELVEYYSSSPSLALSQMHFLELLLGSGLFPSLFEEPLSTQLKKAAESQLANRRMMPDYYSVQSRKTAELLVREMEGKRTMNTESAGLLLKKLSRPDYATSTKASGDLLGSIILYTPYGNSIDGFLYEELTASEIIAHDQVYTTLFPNATLIEHSSAAYNDISYAWNMSIGGLECWLLDFDQYLIDTSYVSAPSYPGADVVYYNGGDHSAIPVNSTTIISKFPLGPVMQHSVGDFPRILTSPAYYIHGAKIFSISGSDFVYSETALPYTYSYSTIFTAPFGSSFVWSVDGPNEDPADYTMYVSGDDLEIVFNDTGEYNIWCRYYYHGYCFGVASFYVLAVNSGRIEDTEPTE